VRFLADESCDFAVVRILRSAGHDVLAVAELFAGSDDIAVMEIAVREERLLLTEDKDFGRLVYAHSQQSCGVIFIRYPALARKTLPKAVTAFISSKTQADLSNSFTVMSPGRVRRGGHVL
jgi:predicted nuclease of predicted toxin-antitoxin system